MIDPTKRLKIPMPEKYYIYPDARKKLFMHLVNEYKIRYEDLKLLYAYLNFNPDLNIDYLLVFSTKNSAGNPMIMYDAPFLYSDRTTPGYRYCIKNNLLDDFFEEAMLQMTTLPKYSFNEFLSIAINPPLSTDKNNPRYWRNPNVAFDLCKNLGELSLRYAKKG